MSVGMAMGKSEAKGWGLQPSFAWFCLATFSPCPASHDREIVFAPSPPLGALQSLAPLCKTILLVDLPTTITIFSLIKPVSLIKIYLELQINLSHQIKLIFRKNWIILSKCLTRQYHNKNKNLIIQNQWFNSI